MDGNNEQSNRDILMTLLERSSTQKDTLIEIKEWMLDHVEQDKKYREAREKYESMRINRIHVRLDSLHVYGKGIAIVSGLISGAIVFCADKFFGIKVD